jgi:putative membrane protein
MQTRYLFLGLVAGTVPLLYRQVKEKGFSRKYYVHMVLAAVLGFAFFALTKGLFPRVTAPNLIQSLMMGVIYGLAFIVPGLDSAATLSSFGLYEAWLAALADLDLGVLIPAGVGLATGALVISFFMSKLLKHYYTATFSVIFGLFLTIMPRMLNESCIPALNGRTVLSFVLALVGFAISFYFGDLEKHNAWIKQKFAKKETK